MTAARLLYVTLRPDRREALESKLRLFRAAMSRYRLAIDLGVRTGQSVSQDQQKALEAKIQCLETFVANPDPALPPCPLVEEALRASKITGE